MVRATEEQACGGVAVKGCGRRGVGRDRRRRGGGGVIEGL